MLESKGLVEVGILIIGTEEQNNHHQYYVSRYPQPSQDKCYMVRFQVHRDGWIGCLYDEFVRDSVSEYHWAGSYIKQ